MASDSQRDSQRTAESRALGKEALARRIRRWTLLIGVLLVIWAYACYGATWVPSTMDTVPAIPPGSFCVIDKRKSSVKVGSHVFVELPGTGVILSRVSERDGDQITLLHPNSASSIPDSRTLGLIPVTAVRGTILGAFPPGGETTGSGRGR